MNLYSSTGLIIQTILMDVKFDKIPKLPEAVINTNTASKFVVEIEHWTKIVKERCRAMVVVLLFQEIPKIVSIN